MKTKLALLLIAVSLLSVMLCSCEVIKFANNMFGILGLETETDINIGINVPSKNCSHSKVVELESREPTCTTEGITAGKQCGSCKTVIVAQTTIPARGHSYGTTPVVVVEPTSYSAGKSYVSCDKCGEKSYTQIDALELDEGASVGLEYTPYEDGYMVSGIGTCKDTNIVISAGYKGKKVVAISINLLSRSWDIKSVTISRYVHTIDKMSIIGTDSYYTSCLENIYIDSSNPYFISDNGVLYNKDKTELLVYPSGKKDKNFEIPDTVKVITSFAFSYNKNLETVFIPNSVISIEDSSFDECPNLKNINIPDSLVDIYFSAFTHCGSLEYNEYGNGLYLGNANNPYFALLTKKNYNITSLNVHPDTVIIADYAFESSYKPLLTSVVFEGNNLKFIGDGAFSDCPLNIDFVIPDSVVSIGYGAFYGCTSLTSVVIPNSVEYINEFAFACCANLTSVVLGNSVTSIGQGAFHDCTSLENVVIGNSVTSIGAAAFLNCTSLENVVIGNSVTSIGQSAFESCSSLSSVVMGRSVTDIYGGAFRGCYNLKDVYYVGSQEQWKQIDFTIENNPLKYANIHYNYVQE